MNNTSQTAVVDIHEIRELLPHAYPFLLVDRVIDLVPNETVRAIKNVTINEPFFAGHFPIRPVMPGVLIIEAMAQACGILAMKSTDVSENSLFYFAGIDDVRFKSKVEPGDQLLLEGKLIKQKQHIAVYETTAQVDGKVVCKATIRTALKEIS